MKSQAVVWPAQGQAAIEEIDLHEPGSGEVLLEAECTLISPGTERAFLLSLPNAAGRYPARPGYNFVGRVQAVGAGVEEVAVGDRVAASAPHAAHALASPGRMVPVPEELDAEAAVFFNMATIALQGMRRAHIELGESVAVVGQGLIGLLALQFCRLQGGLPVVAVDPVESRLELARHSGADIVVNPEDDEQLGEVVAGLGGGACVVIEATGAPEPINAALKMAAPAGRVVLLASTRGETQVNFYRDVHRKGLSVLGAHNGARPARESRPGVWTWQEDAGAVLELLRYGRLEVVHLITHRLPGSEAPAAYELLKQWDPGLLGVVLQWNQPG